MVVPFVWFYRGPRQRIPRDAPQAPSTTLSLLFLFSNAGFRTKARQGQSDGESGEVCCEFASFSSTLLLVETRREPELAYMARPRCRLFLRPRTPRPPSPSDRAAVREEFSDMKELAPSHQ